MALVRRLIVLLLVLWAPAPLWAAITVDTVSGSGGTTSTSHSHTVAADANLVMACVVEREDGLAVAQATSVTIGGQAMTALPSGAGVNSTTRLRAEWFYRLAPSTGAQTVAVTGGAGTDRMVTTVITLKGAAQSSTFNTPSVLGSTAAGTNVDLNSIASAVGELGLLCGISRVETVTPSPDAATPVSTELIEQPFNSGGTSTLGFIYSEDGASPTIDMRVDLSGNEIWAVSGVSVRAAAAASVVPSILLLGVGQ